MTDDRTKRGGQDRKRIDASGKQLIDDSVVLRVS